MSKAQSERYGKLRERMLERRQELDYNDFVSSTLKFAWENGGTESGPCLLPNSSLNCLASALNGAVMG